MPRLHVLGGGAWVPTPQRQTSAFLIETRRSLIFLGCGSGLSRLHDPMFQLLLSRHQRVVLLISHYRLDHVVGLSYLPYFFADHEVMVGAPPPAVAGMGSDEAFERLLGAPFFSRSPRDWGDLFPKGFQIRELRPGRNNLLGERIAVTPLPGEHQGALIRVREVAWVAGSGVREESLKAAEGAALLIHDGHLDRDGAGPEGNPARLRHGVAPEVALLAQKAGVSELVLSEINPAYEPERLDRMLLDACRIFPRTLVASDMMCAEIKGDPEDAAAEEAEKTEGAEGVEGNANPEAAASSEATPNADEGVAPISDEANAVEETKTEEAPTPDAEIASSEVERPDRGEGTEES